MGCLSSFLLLVELSGFDLSLGSGPNLLSSALDFLSSLTSWLSFTFEAILIKANIVINCTELRKTTDTPFIKQSPASELGMPSELATYPLEHGFGIELLLIFQTVIDECKSTGSSTTELGLQSENRDSAFIGFQFLCKRLLDLCFRNVARFWVDELDGLNMHELDG